MESRIEHLVLTQKLPECSTRLSQPATILVSHIQYEYRQMAIISILVNLERMAVAVSYSLFIIAMRLQHRVSSVTRTAFWFLIGLYCISHRNLVAKFFFMYHFLPEVEFFSQLSRFTAR